MLKEEYKQSAILIVFCLIVHEVLTGATLFFAGLGTVLGALNIKLNIVLRNILAIGIFASYWFTYGKIIDPEVGLNFLTSIIILKILERESVRDKYMIFFGLLLLISAGSLFEKTLTYLLFYALSFWVLIRDFYSFLGKKWSLKDFLFSFIWILPLILFLFVLIPRLLNPVPFDQNALGHGEVGYTPDVQISEIDSLVSNNAAAFDVSVSRDLLQSELYWRGNTLSYNDGWNWKEMVQDKESPEILLLARARENEIKQSFRLFSRSDYFFSIDYPRVISYQKKNYGINGHMRTLPQRRWDWMGRFEVISDPLTLISDPGPHQAHYLKVLLPRKQKETIKKIFQGKSLEELIQSIKTYFMKEQFSYSLAPGKTESLMQFFKTKVGLCSHYASATAIILRIHGIPTRLVSGYMGGSYNKYAHFYHITQNDAHVWLEAYAGGVWKKIDPTEWIAPDRVRLGGDAFMESIREGLFKKNSFLTLPSFVQDLKLWFKQWDFLFYQWLEEIDYNTQEAWLSRLSIKREWIISIIPLLMVLFMIFYMAYLRIRRAHTEIGENQKLWRLFYQKMKKRGVLLSAVGLNESYEIIKQSNDPVALKVWDDLMGLSFEGKEISSKEIKKKIKKL